MADLSTTVSTRRGLRSRLDRHGLVVEATSGDECLRFDADGRWTVWSRGTIERRRDLLGGVHVAQGRRRVRLSDDASLDVTEAVAARAAPLAATLDEEGVGSDDGTAASGVRIALRRAGRWDRARHLAHRRLAATAYPDGIPILPPHRARDVVVEAARGCPNGRCSFCAFYAGTSFRPLDDRTFAAHLHDVLRLWGAEAVGRDGVFLGAASAASLGDRTLSRRLRAIASTLGRRRRGVAAFLDPDHAPRRAPAAWASLREEGLVETTVGLETGLASLRRACGKSDDVAAFERSVRAAKDGGLRVCATVLVGLGGPPAAVAHRDATAASLARLGLTRSDLVYLSPLAGSLPDLDGEVRRWRDALPDATPAQVAMYPADRFVAWA